MFAHGLGDIGNGAAIDRCGRAELAGHVELVVGDVDGDDLCAETRADHDGGEADAAAAMNRQPLATLQPSLIRHRRKEVAKRQPRPAAVA